MAANFGVPIATSRVPAAFLIAPGTAGLAVVAAEAVLRGATGKTFLATLILVWLYAYFAALCCGVPAWLFIRRRFLLGPAIPALIGGLAAAGPLMVFDLLLPTASYSVDGRVLIADYHYTAYGWHQEVMTLGLAFVAGTLGGLIFWIIAAGRSRSA